MANPIREPAHFAYIDAVRGFAFLGVLAVHCASLCGDFPLAFIARQGGNGVQLFFLASAITLCNSMASRREGKMDYVNFYLRRLFRIAPLFWLAMVVYWTIPGVLPRAWFTMWAPDGFHASYFLLTGLFLHGWHPYTFNCIVPGGWSIAVEMTFYLVFPFCFHHITTLRKAAFCLLAGIAFTVVERFYFTQASSWIWPDVHDKGILGFFNQFWFPSQFAVFLLGIFTYFLLKEAQTAKIYKSCFWSCWLLLVCLMFLVNLMHHEDSGYLHPLFIVMALSGMIISLAGSSIPMVVNPLICNLGKISYSCYITHFAALAIIIRFLHGAWHQYISRSAGGEEIYDAGSEFLNLGVFLLITVSALILTVLFSTITYHLVENPGIALGKSIIRRLNERALLAGKKPATTV